MDTWAGLGLPMRVHIDALPADVSDFHVASCQTQLGSKIKPKFRTFYPPPVKLKKRVGEMTLDETTLGLLKD